MAAVRVDGERCTTIDVQCPCCLGVTPIKLDPDDDAREMAVMRAEIARLHGVLDSTIEEFREYKSQSDFARAVDALAREFKEHKPRSDFARAVDAIRIAETGASIIHAAAEILFRRDAMAGEPGRAWPGPAAAPGSASSGNAERIARLRARVRALEKKIKYYETINSRRGMPSLYGAEAWRFDKKPAEPRGRPAPRAVRGPPMGHAGRPHGRGRGGDPAGTHSHRAGAGRGGDRTRQAGSGGP